MGIRVGRGRGLALEPITLYLKRAFILLIKTSPKDFTHLNFLKPSVQNFDWDGA